MAGRVLQGLGAAVLLPAGAVVPARTPVVVLVLLRHAPGKPD
ncbi:hypothetical protein [Streptomyces sp. NPDC051132]